MIDISDIAQYLAVFYALALLAFRWGVNYYDSRHTGVSVARRIAFGYFGGSCGQNPAVRLTSDALATVALIALSFIKGLGLAMAAFGSIGLVWLCGWWLVTEH